MSNAHKRKDAFEVFCACVWQGDTSEEMRGRRKLRWETYEDQTQKRLITNRADYWGVIKNGRYRGIFFVLCLNDPASIMRVVSVLGFLRNVKGARLE